MDASQLLRGVLDLAVLAVLDNGDAYGYDIVRQLRERGLEDVAEASVYGTLRRLYEGEYVSSYMKPSDSGPHRKYYTLTDIGRSKLNDDGKDWTRFSEIMETVLDRRRRRR